MALRVRRRGVYLAITEDIMRFHSMLIAAALLVGCRESSDPSSPQLDVQGNYSLTQLSFDPQGSLSAVDLRSRIHGSIPRIVLVSDGRAQLIFEDDSTGLITTANASYTLERPSSVAIVFDGNTTLYRGSFLSGRMTFTYDAGQHALTYSGVSPDGIDRKRLLAAVPEWTDEQLFDPVPGTLLVTFRAAAQ